MTKRLYNNFEFVGELNFTKEPFSVRKSDSGWESHEMRIIINESKTNGQFASIKGGLNVGNGKPNLVYTSAKSVFGEDGGNLQVAWDDRLNSEIVDSVADYRKVVLDLTENRDSLKDFYDTRRAIYNLETKTEGITDTDKEKLTELYDKARELSPDRHEFIHNYDLINYIRENGILEKYKGRKFRVKGNIEKSYSKEKFYTNYAIQSIELVSDETPSKLSAQLDLYFVKGAEDTSDFKENKLITYDTYIIARDNNAKKDVFFPHITVLNASKLDLENTEHVDRIKFIRQFFNVKSKNVHHMVFETRVFRGAQKVELSLEDLSPLQQQSIKLGYSKLEDYAPKGGVLGASVEETRLIKPLLQNFNKSNDFMYGTLETEYTADDLVYVPVVFEKKEEKVTEKPATDVEEDLFDLDLSNDIDELLA